MKKIVYFKFFFFISSLLFAQNLSINGYVKDNNSEPLHNAVVQLFLDDTFKGFKKTNSQGFFNFINLEKGVYTLKVNVLNYSQYQENIELNEGKSIEIFLSEELVKLEEVIINNKSFGKVKEDTIQYNLAAIRTGNERTLGDLIEKLPGLQIDENGVVYYQGKKMDNILIDGAEFFGNKHQLATKNITDEMIEGIDLISNYQPNDILKSFSSGGKKVLNIKLKENYQNTISGNASFALGNDFNTNNRINLFNFNKKGNIAFINHYNTIGEVAMTMEDYFELNQTIKRNGNGVSKIDEKDIPSFLREQRNFYDRKNFFSSLNYNQKINDKLLIKNYTLFDFNTSIKRQDTYKNYGIFKLNEIQQIDEKPYFVQNVFNLDWKINKNNYVVLDSKFDYTQNTIDSDINQNLYSENSKEQNFIQKLNWFNVLNDNLLGELTLDFNSQTKNYLITEQEEINTNQSKFNLYKIGYSVKSSKNKFTYNYYTNTSLQNYNLSTLINQKNKEENRLFNAVIGGVFSYLYNKNLLISSSLIVNYYNSNQKSLEQNFSISPVVSLAYTLNKGGKLTLKYSYLDAGIPTLDFLNTYERRVDYLTILDQSSIDELFIKRTNSVSINYLKLNLSKGRTFFVNVSYDQNKNDIAEDIRYQNNLIYKAFFKAEQTDNLLLFINYDYIFNKIPIAFKANGILNYTENVQKINNELNNLYSTNFNLKTNFTSRFKSNLQVYYKNTLQVFVNDNKKIDRQNIFTIKNDFGVTYNYKNAKIKVGVLNDNQIIKNIEVIKNTNWNFYTEIDYKLKNFDLFIQGFNFINLNQNSMLKNISTTDYQGYVNLKTLSGYLMGGIRFNL
ncbi:carboxypeptidase-like regulatory domain-containing protein [Empedobacter sp.]|uniref:TonB-dependent receptor n=1 Tax=Empedobacter sp. TaxID=1927715 RepID=UPI0028A13B81|nr:carboxypeptidase-like regulatory domain-containing protein [Empedobacter sp.]